VTTDKFLIYRTCEVRKKIQ